MRFAAAGGTAGSTTVHGLAVGAAYFLLCAGMAIEMEDADGG
jgi:hypothetical protein